MFQSLIDRFGDVLLPIAFALFLWFGLHYVVFTPRILHVDMPKYYQSTDLALMSLPRAVHRCHKKHLADAVLQTARMDAALYTASFSYISKGFHYKSIVALESLNGRCGTGEAIARAKENQRERDKVKAFERKIEKYCGYANFLLGQKVC